MTVLGIETATRICGVALLREATLLSERWTEEEHVHSEKLLLLADDLLRSCAATLQQIDGIAVSIGPGSFTGLRIGLSAAKGLSYACGKALAAVPTLDALARRVQRWREEVRRICVVLDAKRDDVYCAWYERHGPQMERTSHYQVLSRDEFLHLLCSMLPVVVTGEDAERVEKDLQALRLGASSSERVIVAPRELRTASSASVAQIGSEILRTGEVADLTGLEPLYLKDFAVRTGARTYSGTT